MESFLQNPLISAYVAPLVGFLAFVIVGWFVAGIVRRTIRSAPSSTSRSRAL